MTAKPGQTSDEPAATTRDGYNITLLMALAGGATGIAFRMFTWRDPDTGLIPTQIPLEVSVPSAIVGLCCGAAGGGFLVRLSRRRILLRRWLTAITICVLMAGLGTAAGWLASEAESRNYGIFERTIGRSMAIGATTGLVEGLLVCVLCLRDHKRRVCQ
jgi:hypothetical protein